MAVTGVGPARKGGGGIPAPFPDRPPGRIHVAPVGRADGPTERVIVILIMNVNL